MNKLLIVDVQHSYMEWVLMNNLLEKIPELAKGYSHICYLWDNTSDQDLYEEIP